MWMTRPPRASMRAAAAMTSITMKAARRCGGRRDQSAALSSIMLS